MILDSSAVVAILFKEPEREAFLHRTMTSAEVGMSAATMVETVMVVEGRGGLESGHDLDRFLDDARVQIIPFSAEHAALARDAWRRFGKGRHPAGLNLGDCFAYALARSRNEPLLFKGDDFAQTDVKAAI